MWLLSRNPPGAEDDPTLNEPDYQDALDQQLAPHGVTFVETVPEFARWRWYTGARDDGAHFSEASELPADADVRISATVAPDAGRIDIEPAPMLLGSAYVAIESATASQVTVQLDGDPAVAWVADALPGTGGTDGDRLDFSGGSVVLDLVDGSRTVVLTAMPLDGVHDPDERTDDRFGVALVVVP